MKTFTQGTLVLLLAVAAGCAVAAGQPAAQKTGTGNDGFLDITFIGDSYNKNQMNVFSGDVARFTNYLLTYEPFHSRAGQIRFHSVNNTSSLNCKYTSGNPNGGDYLSCNSNLVAHNISASGVTTDFAVVIENNALPGGGTSGNQVYAYNGNAWPAPGEQWFVHYIGMAVGNLLNETTTGATGPIDNQVHGNCYAGTPPAAAWNGIVPFAFPLPSNGGGYLAGCNNYSNWYRASGSILSGYGRPQNMSFDVPSQLMISAGMNAFTSPYVDQVPPVVFIDNLSDGVSVSGDIFIQTTPSDDMGGDRVELWKDGVMYESIRRPPYTFDWLTAYDTAGLHSIQVKAVDVAGNVGVSPVLGINVIGLADSIAPTGDITYPVTGDTVSGVITVTATATDNVGVDRVELQVAEVTYATDYAPPYNFTLDTRAYPNGTYFLNLRIWDTSGNLKLADTGQVVYFKN